MQPAKEPQPAPPDLAALQQEIEAVHREVHRLAEDVADLRRLWFGLPAWLRWLSRPGRG
jgi:hypothetical protein